MNRAHAINTSGPMQIEIKALLGSSLSAFDVDWYPRMHENTRVIPNTLAKLAGSIPMTGAYQFQITHAAHVQYNVSGIMIATISTSSSLRIPFFNFREDLDQIPRLTPVGFPIGIVRPDRTAIVSAVLSIELVLHPREGT